MRRSTKREHKKETNLGTEEYHDWTKEFEREPQQQTRTSTRIIELEDRSIELIQSEEQK